MANEEKLSAESYSSCLSHLCQSHSVKALLVLPALLGVASDGNEKEVLWDFVFFYINTIP